MIEIVKDDPGFPDTLEYYHTQGEIEQIKRRQAFDIMSRKIQRANDAIEKHTGKNVNKLTNLELNAARTKLRIDNFTGMFILGPEKVTASMKISGLEFPETLVTAEPTALRQAGPTPSVTKTPQGLGYPGPSRSKSSRSSTKRPVAKSPFQEPDENTQGLLSKLMETLTGSAKKAPEPEDLRSTLPFDFERLPDTPVRTKSTLTKNIAAASTASPKKKSTDLLPAKRLTRSPTKKINDLPVATMLAPIKKVAVTTTKKKSAPIPSVSSAEPPVEVRPARRPTRSPTKKLNDPFDSKSARCASGGTEAFHATKLGDISSVESSKTSLTKKKRLAENTLADQSSPKKSKRETPGRRKGN